jgi:rhodanese-related sulfurtransferase
MKKLSFKTKIIFSFLLLFGLISCIDDNIIPPLTGDLNTTAEMLVYFESLGDFPNNSLAPGLINADEVFANMGTYLIIDIRNNAEFDLGHIENAHNVNTDSLYDFVEMNLFSYSKIIIVSKNGQRSAYFTCLLRLAGFDNVYSMKYGLAYWNLQFADEWINGIGDTPDINSYTNQIFEKDEHTPLPLISFPDPGAPIEERIEYRIKEIISFGFTQNEVYRYHLNPDLFTVCYGKSRLYNAPRDGVLGLRGHPEGAISYLDATFYHFRSVNYLQTLPNSEEIMLYDYDGQLGACMTAYLRVLGYDVKFLLFGANQLFYSRVITDVELMDFAFTSQDINNFPFVTGE